MHKVVRVNLVSVFIQRELKNVNVILRWKQNYLFSTKVFLKKENDDNTWLSVSKSKSRSVMILLSNVIIKEKVNVLAVQPSSYECT